MRVTAIKFPKGEIEKRLTHEMHRLWGQISSELLAWKAQFSFGLEIDSLNGVNPTRLFSLHPTCAAVGRELLVPAGGSKVQNAVPQRFSAGHRSKPQRAIWA